MLREREKEMFNRCECALWEIGKQFLYWIIQFSPVTHPGTYFSINEHFPGSNKLILKGEGTSGHDWEELRWLLLPSFDFSETLSCLLKLKFKRLKLRFLPRIRCEKSKIKKTTWGHPKKIARPIPSSEDIKSSDDKEESLPLKSRPRYITELVGIRRRLRTLKSSSRRR